MKLKKMIIGSFMLTTVLQADELRVRALQSNLKPIPDSALELAKITENPKNPMTNGKVDLGKMLYFEPRISKSGLISCNSCHNLSMGGVDGVSAAIGHKWTANPHALNSPTVYNSVFHTSQFWDGRSPDLEDQAQGPIQAAPEMAASQELVVSRLNSIPAYVDLFAKVYPQEPQITFKKVADSIAAFERTLVTPSRYDQWLLGDDKAMSTEEKAGLKTFLDKGCIACHNGIGLGGNMMQKFPLMGEWKEITSVGDFKGNQYGLTKVPSLRNIEETAPYLHNGTVWDLNKLVKIMGEAQLGQKLTDVEANSIVAFLKSLTGKKPIVKIPQLPASTVSTPKPDVN